MHRGAARVSPSRAKRSQSSGAEKSKRSASAKGTAESGTKFGRSNTSTQHVTGGLDASTASAHNTSTTSNHGSSHSGLRQTSLGLPGKTTLPPTHRMKGSTTRCMKCRNLVCTCLEAVAAPVKKRVFNPNSRVYATASQGTRSYHERHHEAHTDPQEIAAAQEMLALRTPYQVTRRARMFKSTVLQEAKVRGHIEAVEEGAMENLAYMCSLGPDGLIQMILSKDRSRSGINLHDDDDAMGARGLSTSTAGEEMVSELDPSDLDDRMSHLSMDDDHVPHIQQFEAEAEEHRRRQREAVKMKLRGKQNRAAGLHNKPPSSPSLLTATNVKKLNNANPPEAGASVVISIPDPVAVVSTHLDVETPPSPVPAAPLVLGTENVASPLPRQQSGTSSAGVALSPLTPVATDGNSLAPPVIAPPVAPSSSTTTAPPQPQKEEAPVNNTGGSPTSSSVTSDRSPGFDDTLNITPIPLNRGPQEKDDESPGDENLSNVAPPSELVMDSPAPEEQRDEHHTETVADSVNDAKDRRVVVVNDAPVVDSDFELNVEDESSEEETFFVEAGDDTTFMVGPDDQEGDQEEEAVDEVDEVVPPQEQRKVQFAQAETKVVAAPPPPEAPQKSEADLEMMHRLRMLEQHVSELSNDNRLLLMTLASSQREVSRLGTQVEEVTQRQTEVVAAPAAPMAPPVAVAGGNAGPPAATALYIPNHSLTDAPPSQAAGPPTGDGVLMIPDEEDDEERNRDAEHVAGADLPPLHPVLVQQITHSIEQWRNPFNTYVSDWVGSANTELPQSSGVARNFFNMVMNGWSACCSRPPEAGGQGDQGAITGSPQPRQLEDSSPPPAPRNAPPSSSSTGGSGMA